MPAAGWTSFVCTRPPLAAGWGCRTSRHVLALVVAARRRSRRRRCGGVERETVGVVAETRVLVATVAPPAALPSRTCSRRPAPVRRRSSARPTWRRCGFRARRRLDERGRPSLVSAVHDLDPHVGGVAAVEHVGDLRRPLARQEGVMRARLGGGELELAAGGDLGAIDDLQWLVARRLGVGPVSPRAHRPRCRPGRDLDFDRGPRDRARRRCDSAAAVGREADLVDPVEPAAAELDAGADGSLAHVGAALEAQDAGQHGRIRSVDPTAA